MKEMQQSTESLNNEILQHLLAGTLQSWLLDMKRDLPQHVSIKEAVSNCDYCLQMAENLTKGEHGYFFMPCFELVIDPTKCDTRTTISLIEKQFKIREIEIQNNLLHLLCEWIEGEIVYTKENIIDAALTMCEGIDDRLDFLTSAIVEIYPTVYIAG